MENLDLNYIDKVLNSSEKILGEIYKITNLENGKVYIGQTHTHRKNKNKYKPYGYLGRFNTHVSDALCNTKKSQVRYLASSIRLYGKEKFTIELIERCLPENIDEREIYYISHFSSMFPNGYNLTSGGRNNYPYMKKIEIEGIDEMATNISGNRGGCKFRSEKTRQKISAFINEYVNNPEIKFHRMKMAQNQHMDRKLNILKELDLSNIDENNIDQYIRIRKDHKINKEFVCILIQKRQIAFRGKHETINEIKERAKSSLIELIKQAKLSNCSGNP